MVHQELNRGDELLNLAVERFKLQPIPEFTNPSVHFPAVGESSGHSCGPASKSQLPLKHTFSRRRLAVAVGLVFAMVVGGFSIFPLQTASQRAFAQMQEAIRDLNSLVFEMTTYSGKEITGKYHISYAQSGDARMDSGLGAHVLNASQEEYMIVDDAERVATIQPVYDLASIQEKTAGVLGALLNLKPLPSTGMRTLNQGGKVTREFKTIWDGSVATVIVDAETNLPISIEVDRGKGQDGRPLREVASSFQFNVSLPDSQFSILPPNGYDVERIERHDPITSSANLVLVAGEGLGPIRFGMSLQEVRDQLGDPESFESKPVRVTELDENGQVKFPMKLVPVDPPQMIGVMQYRSLGLQIDVSSINGVEWIRCFERRLTWDRFAGATAQGVRIGMSKNEVKSLLLEQELSEKILRQTDDRWLLNGMDILFDDDKCVGITIGKSNFLENQ